MIDSSIAETLMHSRISTAEAIEQKFHKDVHHQDEFDGRPQSRNQ